MSRKPVLTGGKKEELISAALKLFMENGYENTSIRLILNEVNGEVGMFYHYFKSKSEIFEAAAELHFRQYAERFGSIAENTSLSPPEQLNQIFRLFQSASSAYLSMNHNSGLHWTVELALREKTLEELEPHITIILQNAIKAELVRQPDVPVEELAAFLVHGIAGVTHQKTVKACTPERFATKKKDIIKLIATVLKVSPELIGGQEQ